MGSIPSGTVTFLFSDIEGSTQLLRQLGDRYGALLDDHRSILREQLGGAGGQEIDTQGDAFFFSFSRARDAVAGAVSAQRALRQHDWPDGVEVRVRMGLHTGEPALGAEGYHGLDVVRASRICSAGHGGQILLSETTRTLVGNELPEGVSVHDLGRHELKDVQEQQVFELLFAEEGREFPPLRAAEPEPLSASFGRRIDEHVTAEIERALSESLAPKAKRPRRRFWRR